MANFILILGMSIGVAGLIALGLSAFIKWVTDNPIIIVGIAIGAIIATIATLKIKAAQDNELVRKYQQRQHEVPPLSRSKHNAVESVELEDEDESDDEDKPEETESNNDDFYYALTGSPLRYTKGEAKEAMGVINRDNPTASLEDKIKAAITYLSGD